jgi:hypothetical protein
LKNSVACSFTRARGEVFQKRKEATIMQCDQCEMLSINGVACHETGCPNSRKTWIEERGEWILFLECRECGSEVEQGESCDCMEPVEEEREEEELERPAPSWLERTDGE